MPASPVLLSKTEEAYLGEQQTDDREFHLSKEAVKSSSVLDALWKSLKTATRYRIGVVTVAWLIANVQHITSAGSKHVQHHREALLNAWAFHCKSQAYTPCQGAAKSRRHFFDSCRDKQFESVFTSPNFLDHTFSCLYVWPALELLSAGGQRFPHCSWQIHGVRSKISLNAIQRTFSAG